MKHKLIYENKKMKKIRKVSYDTFFSAHRYPAGPDGNVIGQLLNNIRWEQHMRCKQQRKLAREHSKTGKPEFSWQNQNQVHVIGQSIIPYYLETDYNCYIFVLQQNT